MNEPLSRLEADRYFVLKNDGRVVVDNTPYFGFINGESTPEEYGFKEEWETI